MSSLIGMPIVDVILGGEALRGDGKPCVCVVLVWAAAGGKGERRDACLVGVECWPAMLVVVRGARLCRWKLETEGWLKSKLGVGAYVRVLGGV